MATSLAPGMIAPDFTLPTDAGGTVKLSDYRGKKIVVVYFYPEDNTLGCTIESCTFRDDYEDFVAAGAEVIGISQDSVESHQKFRADHRLPFVLASDPDGSATRAYGAEKLPLALRGRITFVVDREGVIRDVFDSPFRVKTHVSRALELVKKLSG
jgi:thioredoxin-dependent peroxiredoxin